MREKVIDYLLKIIKFLENLHARLSSNNLTELDYSSLSPIDNGDVNGHYSRALQWALDNRTNEDIKNIALTGSYGSGKSTILKTFQKNYKESNLTFLNISLATFKEEKKNLDENGNPIEREKDELLRLIETSILQQIFYHEEDKNIPDSRFKKIKSYGLKKQIIISFGILLFITSLINYFHPNVIQDIFKDSSLSINVQNLLHYGSIIFILIGVFFLLFKSIRIISSFTINKLKFQNAEIGIGENINKSILNHHLDEILYFFTIRPYNVVIIEDLDRFQETEIFTKLREINLLLNNSKKTRNKNIVFIYAVRDDMFSDNERIKFFDFIIPVIPVINSSNSSEKLRSKKEKYNYNLTDSFIEDISFFIDDMRLLHNVTNEFFLYKVKHGETPLNENKLFALITYKNIYPNDFVSLSRNEGELYKVFSSKSMYINQEIDTIKGKISILKDEIKNLDLVNFKNLKELRQLYIIRALESSENFNSFIINDQPITIDDLLKDEFFEYLKNDETYYKTTSYDRYNRPQSSIKKVEKTFIEIEKTVDSEKSYNDKEKEILDIKSHKIYSLKQEIQELEKQKIEVRNLKISELVQSNENIDLNVSEKLNNDFITLLIRNEYISEDYLDYISLFYEGSITRNDHKFIISLRNRQKLDFNYKLIKIDKIISKINLIDFNSSYILNYDILDFLFKTPKTYENELTYIFTKLKDESPISIQFIRGFIDKTNHLNLFINQLCNHWSNIWGHYVNDISFPDDELNNILKLIIKHAEISSINKINSNSNIEDYLLNDPKVLSITSDKNKLKALVEDFQLKFDDLDFENSPEDLLNFIYENNFYAIKRDIVVKIIKQNGEFNQITFDISNYSSIKNSKCDNLVKYVDSNIEFYVEHLYLKLDANINEEEKTLLKLLNNKTLSLKLKKEIIDKTLTKISDISLVENGKLVSFLFENSKIEPLWENLFFLYQTMDNSITESLINYINNIENAEQLAEIRIPTEVNDENIYGIFCKELIERNDIENKSYNLISKSIPWWYSDLKISEFEPEKIVSLIENRKIRPEIESFNFLKEHFKGLNIKLLEKHKEKFIEKIDELILDAEDINLILKSTLFIDSEKILLSQNTLDETILSKPENIKLIGNLISTNSSLNIRESLTMKIILDDNVSTTNRIKIFNKILFSINTPTIEEFLNNLGDTYAKITNKNKKAKLSDNPINRKLLQNLIDKNYISSFSTGSYGLKVNHKRS